jgi:hypothetical protein
MNIVLDTNCLVIAISRQSEYHQVWQDFLAGKLIIKDHTMAALGLGGKPYKKIKVTHLWGTATIICLVAPDLQQTLTLLPLICDKKVVSLPLI